MSELLPCPFCGSESAKALLPTSHLYDDGVSGRHYPIVFCYNCSAQILGKDHDMTKESAITKWNTRQSGWVSVEDRNPDKDGKYIVMVNGGLIEMDRFYKDWARYGGFVTHWMPLPPKPPEN